MIMNFIVTGDSFPYQYYLAVKTAQKTQKAKAKIWMMEGGIQDTRYLDLLTDSETGYLPRLNRKALEGKDTQFIKGHTKDYYMWKILKEEGGFYFDLDMIFLKDVIELLGDKEMLLSREYETDGDWYSWGANLMGAKKGSDIMTTMFGFCEEAMEDPSNMRWVTIGPELTTKAMKMFPIGIEGLPFPVGCGVSGQTLSQLYEDGEFDERVRVLHLYGAAGRFVKGENRFEKIDSNFVRTSQSRLAKAIRMMLTEEEYDPLPYVHFICTGKDFPYQYYLAVKTTQKTQHAKVKVWFVNDVKSPCLDLLDVERERLQQLDVPAFRGKDEHYILSHTKDYYMWEILYKYGGFCFDLDIMAFKDITKDMKGYDVMVCKQYSTNTSDAWMSGLVGAVKGTEIINDTIIKCSEYLQNPNMEWGTTGPKAVYNMTKYGNVVTLPYPVGGARALLHPLYEPGDISIAFNAKVVQLYAGAIRFCKTEDFWHRMNPEYIKNADTCIAKAIRTVLTEEEYNPKLEDKMWWKKATASPKKVYRFHMLGLVHLPCSKEYMSCAFTQKNHKLARMLLSLGHEVIYYGSEGSDVPCTKFIQTHMLKDICADYGDGDNRFEIGYDWTNTDFRHDFNSDRKPSTLKFNKNTIEAIDKIKKPDDFLLMTQGYYQKPIADAVKLFLTCEPGIGYRGSIRGNYGAFESAYIQNFTYGSAHPFECINGSYYDRVIPNYFDPEDSEFSKEKKDYYFFIGRMIKRKGILTAYLATQAVGAKLIIAGQGGVVLPDGTLTASNTPDFSMPKGNWEYVGFVSGQQRKDLFKYAKATFTPTEYLECLLPGEIVLGSNKNIEEFVIGDAVVQSDASIGSVKATICNDYNGEYYEVKPRFTFPLRLTPEHPLLIATLNHRYDSALKKAHKKPTIFFKESTRWVKVKDVKNEDYLVIPKYNKVKDVDSLNLSSYINGRIQDAFRAKFADIKVDQDLMWFLGLYLAEGHIVRGKNHNKYIENKGIGFTLNKQEDSFADRIRRIANIKFGCKVTTNVRDDNSMQLRILSYTLSKFIEDTFGSGASNKSIAWWIIDLPKEKLLSFMQGYIDGDGYYHNNEQLSIKTVSKVMALQLQLLCTKFDILLGIAENKAMECSIKGRVVSRRDIYSLRSRVKSILNPDNMRVTTRKLYKEDSENFYIPIRKIVKKNYSGKVYNLHTENNTFLVSNVVTHNCFAGTHIESMLHGTPIITTDFGVYSGGTFIDGVHGFKCNTLDDFIFATKNAPKLDPLVIRKWAERYLMDNVRWEYQKWFDDLYQVFLSATMPDTKGWHYIRKEEPEWRKVLYKQFF